MKILIDEKGWWHPMTDEDFFKLIQSALGER